MQAIELVGFIDNQHEMHLKLPEQAQIGRAKVIVLYEENETSITKGNLDGFLDCLPLNQIGRSHEDILLQVQEERDSWQD
ncbi:MAG: hypothetical protein ACOYMG_12860 [Candidatus Methylumidiphilus sp.]